MASEDKCAGPGPDTTWHNPGHASAFPSMNVPPLIKKTPTIQRAKNKIKRGIKKPVGHPSLARMPALFSECVTFDFVSINCFFVVFATHPQCVCVSLCVPHPNSFWMSWARVWTFRTGPNGLLKLLVSQKFHQATVSRTNSLFWCTKNIW